MTKKEVPATEVSARPTRRRFTAEYKLKVLEELDAAGRGETGAILRREGLYSSHVSTWRQTRREGAVKALKKKRGRPPIQKNPLAEENSRLERENRRLQLKLNQAEAIIDLQKKVAKIFEMELPMDGKKENV